MDTRVSVAVSVRTCKSAGSLMFAVAHLDRLDAPLRGLDRLPRLALPDLWERLAPLLALQDLQPLVPLEGALLPALVVEHGDLRFWAGKVCPLQWRTSPKAPPLLLLLRDGWLQVQLPGEQRELEGGRALFLPGGSSVLRCSSASLVAVALSPARLAASLEHLAARGGQRSAQPALLRKPQTFSGENPFEASLLAAMEAALDLLQACAAGPEAVSQVMALDEQIYRLLILLTQPTLRRRLQRGQALQAPVPPPLDQCLETLLQHPERRYSLKELERLSGYSRRALQYAFRRRYGCTPTQWLRQARLQRANALLQQADATATVTSIARACGYRRVSQFSQEFRAQFGMAPSLVLRHGRLSHPAVNEPPERAAMPVARAA